MTTSEKRQTGAGGENGAAMEKKMDALARLAGGAAHDINNILGAIEGYASLSLRSKAIDPQVRSDLEEIRRAVARASALTRKMLSFSRKSAADKILLEARSFLESLAEKFPREAAPGVTVKVEASPDLPGLAADPPRLEVLLTNLILNARDAMPGGGEIVLKAEAEGDFLKISVRDSGAGMRASVMEHLFEPFFTTKEKGKGVGLGLAEAYGIARQHGGSLAVASEEGKGTEVSLLLPLAGGASPGEASAQVPPRRARGRGPLSVLILEDEADLRSLAARALEDAGFRTAAAASIGEALRLMDEGFTCDVLFADIVLPDGSTVESMPQFLKRAPGLVPVFTSGFVPEERVAAYIRENGWKFFIKPYDLNRLQEMLCRLAEI